MKERIVISRLRVPARIGLLPAEREAPQELEFSLAMQPRMPFSETGDSVASTIDYAEVAEALRGLAMARHRDLLESLADEVGRMLADRFGVVAFDLEIRKFILPDAEFVAVRVSAP